MPQLRPLDESVLIQQQLGESTAPVILINLETHAHRAGNVRAEFVYDGPSVGNQRRVSPASSWGVRMCGGQRR